MTEFRVGDRVVAHGRCGGYGATIFEGDAGTVVDDNYMSGIRIKFDKQNDILYFNGNELGRGEIKIIGKTMDNLQQGDILVNKGIDYKGYQLEVQGTIGKVIFTCDSDEEHVRKWTVNSLSSEGWSLMTESDDVTEVTLEQIAEKMNVPVEKLRIKE